MKQAIRINPADNVAVALSPLAPGTEIEGVTLLEPIEQGHKFALENIESGRPIIKYGYTIGFSTRPIAAGEWVHSHNLHTGLGENLDYTYHPYTEPALPAVEAEAVTFMGYQRADGSVGIRNELWIVPTVGCVNSQALTIAREINNFDRQPADGAHAFTHPYGCSQLADDHENTRRAIAALCRHPNAGGVIVLGLGCENNQIDALKTEIGSYDPQRVRFITAQECDDEIAAALTVAREIIELMATDRRVATDVSKLKIGVKCGGSDGLSGITANPLVGRFTDWLTRRGGTIVMTEVPEMFGAETTLMGRAASQEVFDNTAQLINGFKDYFRACGQPVSENPSPGNKAGGITTLEEKSLGCVQKGGTVATVTDVIDYACPATRPGLNLLWGPGNDLVASTALALSGCHMVLFTTGRGTPLGTCVPTLKIATNSQLALHKPGWIDFNAGELLSHDNHDEVFNRFVDKIISTASGALAKNEVNGSREIAIFKSGVTL